MTSVASAPSRSGSNGSRRAYNSMKRYRTLNAKSEIDESLFGTPNRIKQANALREARSNSTSDINKNAFEKEKIKRTGPHDKEYVKHITKDLIRDILVPEDTGAKSIVIDNDTYQRLLKACNYKSKEQRQKEKEEIAKEREKLAQAMSQKKKELQEMDNLRTKNEALENVDLKAKEEAEYLLQRANQLRQEQEDEVKHLNELIMNAKVHAIRDAQVLEKKQIKKENVEEEKRLDTMMELDRLNALNIQEAIDKRRAEEQREGAKVILKQMEVNRQERLIKDELREQENAAMLKYLEELQKQDWESMLKKKQQQKKLATELRAVNQDMEKQKEFRKQQEVMADLKVLEYQKEKATREAAYEAEQEKKRIEKEKEIARLRSLQERARDLQAEKDALRAKREQERKEREWREKERQEAIKKKYVEEEMKMAREWQIKNKEHFLAVEAAKDRAEFERVLRAQLELAEKEKTEEKKFKDKQSKYNDVLLRQIRENEVQRISERRAFFEEGVKLDEEARMRRQKLDEIKRQKLEELRRAGIPNKYCVDIERKVNASTHVY